ncbi:Transketolase [Geodia barretti]|uniref:transketolase n=3 Tax=Geodia barretti TaxID=519541 RepID=A0AA35SEW6_GEOBA|nr:Transketolase [Geodia barretti]
MQGKALTDSALDQLCINTLRFLAIDSVQNARSGHPGAPMGAAPMAYVLWDRFLKHNPTDPKWPDRDRFVLSAGHASAMLYSLLHLTGYDLPIEELKQFRQWGSRTPGHPEYGLTPGVEVTTGPLGQGLANAVGMALAERWLATRFNRPGHDIIDHYTYAIVSDGDLQEGVAAEAASLAGTLGLGKLILIYDDNQISIEGDTDIAFLEDVPRRFTAYGWQVTESIDGNDIDAVASAIDDARADTSRPSLVVCRTVIGYGSPNKAGTGGVHGAPLGDDEVALTREQLHWPYPESFTVPGEVREYLTKAVERGRGQQSDWDNTLSSYRENFPSEALRLQDALNGALAPGWSSGLSGLFDDGRAISTREASGKVMNAISDAVPNLIGGSADLAPSTLTILNSEGHIGPGNFDGRNLHFGVREHAMGAVANGIAVHGGAIPYASTFLIFSDYLRPALRLSALMEQRVIYVFTHDSIALGEDGPTHQPVEHLMSLRAMPGLVVIRPADATETAVAWQAALERTEGPTALALSRQNLPVLDRETLAPAHDASRGGYTLWESEGSDPQVIIIATGAEVHTALEAARTLDSEGIATRLVSMPSWELFDEQPKEYRDAVLPPSNRTRLSVEAGATNGWARYVGLDGASIGMSTFGASAPGGVLLEQFGFTAARVVEEARNLVNGG